MSTNAVALRADLAPASRFTPDQVDLIRRTICKGATDDELRLFMYQANKTGLDPLARQIHAVKRWSADQGREVMSIQTSIDGFRLIAERTGKYAGQVGPYWCGPDGEWKDVWLDSAPPAAARVGALRGDFKEPVWGVARFASYAQRKKSGDLTRFWATMPDVMIAKVAEALALRRAFPQELSGVYTSDEMPEEALRPVEARPEPKAITAPHDPATGEVLPPHAIPAADGDNFNPVQWGGQFIAAVKTAVSQREIDEWSEQNGGVLDNIKANFPRAWQSIDRAMAGQRAMIGPEPEIIGPEDTNTVLAAAQ